MWFRRPLDLGWFNVHLTVGPGVHLGSESRGGIGMISILEWVGQLPLDPPSDSPRDLPPDLPQALLVDQSMNLDLDALLHPLLTLPLDLPVDLSLNPPLSVDLPRH